MGRMGPSRHLACWVDGRGFAYAIVEGGAVVPLAALLSDQDDDTARQAASVILSLILSDTDT